MFATHDFVSSANDAMSLSNDDCDDDIRLLTKAEPYQVHQKKAVWGPKWKLRSPPRGTSPLPPGYPYLFAAPAAVRLSRLCWLGGVGRGTEQLCQMLMYNPSSFILTLGDAFHFLLSGIGWEYIVRCILF